MNDYPPVIWVDLKRSTAKRLLRRPQPWYWIARSADNQKVLARSSERYTNAGDALHAVELLFGAGSTAFLRRSEHGNALLRRATVPSV